MTTTRQKIATNLVTRGGADHYVPTAETAIPKIFGLHVFNDSVMKERLPKAVYKKLRKTIEEGSTLDASIADVVAAAMKDWAAELGATHYTHWFQPLTGSTAEKHDGFIVPDGDGEVLMRFNGSELIQGEPDASSFPSGGIRATFEARGYTAWDPSSPAFVRMTSQGGTLCIPTAFCSYTGEALDKKVPLLRSIEALSKAGTNLLNLLGETDVTRVTATVGLEQEYFLIDAEYYNARPDLIATGRTLFGAPSYKGQSLEDHYFGNIKPRILSYMQDTEQALYKLGIPIKTRHNEVAPAQYEVAPVFEAANLAVDHNMLVMEVMKEIAAKHKFRMLLHEKPFAGINGSGKHCNWSMSTNTGKNLLDPGTTPHTNRNFLVVLAAVIRAVDKYAKLMRISVAHAGNDHRLGANEAPPAIISAYLGDELGRIVEHLAQGASGSSKGKQTMHLGTDVLPVLPKDNTDRNRTSPFAFTGNKFEFRALGAGQHVGGPVFSLNTIVAESCDYMAEEIGKAMKAGKSLDDACDSVVKATMKAHHRVVFNGDGYSQDWQKEAAKRGLLNLKNTPSAVALLKDKDIADLMEKYKVLTPGELESRYNIVVEAYIKTLDIEFSAALDMARTMILPAAMAHQAKLAGSVAAAKAAGVSGKGQEAVLSKLSHGIETLIHACDKFEKALGHHESDAQAHAEYYADKVLPLMAEVRAAVDALETQVEDSLWPMPKYREMLLLA